jgi:hypothetical protein
MRVVRGQIRLQRRPMNEGFVGPDARVTSQPIRLPSLGSSYPRAYEVAGPQSMGTLRGTGILARDFTAWKAVPPVSDRASALRKVR